MFVVLWLVPVRVDAQQTPCKMSLSALPAAAELKGFRLGMTMEEVKAHVPFITFAPTDDLGNSKTTINPNFDPRTERSNFQGIRTISLEFLDGRLVSLWIGYDSNFKWLTVDDFVTGVSKSLGLPSAWTPWKLRGKEMTCADFQLTVSLIAQSPSFRLVDRAAEEVLNARRVAKEEQESAAAEAAAAEAEMESEEILADSHSKTYYPPGCSPQVEISDKDRVSFKTVEEARKAGYKASPGCS